MKVVIVEDEQPAAAKLKRLIEEVQPGTQVLAVLESVVESINWFHQNPKPDLVFMDIQLDDGISFEIFDAIKLEAPVIFTTAYDEYAIRAFKVNSVDYLLKPIDKEALLTALQKFRKIHSESKSFETALQAVIGQITTQYKSRFFIKVGIKYQSVPVEEICSFFVEERNTFLHTVNGKTFDLDYSLDQVRKLVDPRNYFRINRNFMVNINCISEIVSYSTSRLKLKLKHQNGQDLIVSRDKVAEFKQWMDR